MSRPIEGAPDWRDVARHSAIRAPQLRVLAPIDFEEESTRSRLTAVELAAQWGAELTLLHVSPSVPVLAPRTAGLDAIGLLHGALRSPAGPAATQDVQSMELRRLEQSVLRRLRGVVPDGLREQVHAKFAWRTGDVAREIISYAKEHDVNVIILGQRERSRPWRISRGIVKRIIQNSPCQVLVAYPSGQARVERTSVNAAAS